jgi:hypothetical protein
MDGPNPPAQPEGVLHLQTIVTRVSQQALRSHAQKEANIQLQGSRSCQGQFQCELLDLGRLIPL